MINEQDSESSFQIDYNLEIDTLKRQLNIERITTETALKDIFTFCQKEEINDPILNQETDNLYITSSKKYFTIIIDFF